MSELELLKNPGNLFDKNIIIYGTGSSGEEFLHYLEVLNISPIAFCDSNISKAGTYFCGYPIIAPAEINAYNEKYGCCVIICSMYIKDILRVLDEEKVEADVYTKLTARLAFCYLDNQNDRRLTSAYVKKNKQIKELICAQGADYSFDGDSVLNRRRLFDLLSTNKPIILNYTPGKTGSSSIYDSINKSKFFTMHVHDFSMLFSNCKFSAAEDYWKKCYESFKNQKIKIIIGIREPISREISSFFQLLGVTWGYIIDFSKPFCENLSDYLLESIGKQKRCNSITIYPSHLPYLQSNLCCGCEFDWFHLELKKFWDIDIYADEFDKKNGFQIYQKDNVQVFVYQLEKLNTLEKELREFIGQPDFKLKKANTGQEKIYYKLYQDVLKDYTIPLEFYEFYYENNSGLQHFYNNQDIQRFMNKWKACIPNGD